VVSSSLSRFQLRISGLTSVFGLNRRNPTLPYHRIDARQLLRETAALIDPPGRCWRAVVCAVAAASSRNATGPRLIALKNNPRNCRGGRGGPGPRDNCGAKCPATSCSTQFVGRLTLQDPYPVHHPAYRIGRRRIRYPHIFKHLKIIRPPASRTADFFSDFLQIFLALPPPALFPVVETNEFAKVSSRRKVCNTLCGVILDINKSDPKKQIPCINPNPILS